MLARTRAQSQHAVHGCTSCCIKAACGIPLFYKQAANLAFDQVCSQVFDKFVPVCDMLLTCFRHTFDLIIFVENLVANLLHQSRHVEIDAAGLQQVRWFVRVLDKWNVEKTCFEPAIEPVEAGFSLRILLFVLILT